VLVPAENAEAMAVASMAILTNKTLLKHLGENAAEDASIRFDLDREVKAYLEWYQLILERMVVERSTG
jgi:hypothetical protein